MSRVRELLSLRHAPRRLERYADQLVAIAERMRALEGAVAAREAAAPYERLRERERVARLLMERLPPGEPAPAPRADRPSFEALFAELEARAPAAFALWRPLLDVNAAAYMGFPTHSCSVDGHPMAEAFARFLAPYLRGPILDIGCGPQPVPRYLAGVPVAELAGVDPLDAPHPFAFARGVAERLPWDAERFSTVVCATSLDHVLLLDDALDEIRRVLRPGGRFVTWVSFTAGAKPYAPLTAPERLDAFHLFHFDRPWFLELLGQRFTLDEEYALEPGAPSRFFAWRK